MVKRYRVTLTDEERQELEVLARKRTASVRMVQRARALLLAAEDKGREQTFAEVEVEDVSDEACPACHATRLNMQAHPEGLIPPAIMLSVSIFALNFVADGLRAMLDPNNR